MNRNLIVTIAVVALIILAAGTYMFMNQSSPAPVTPSENNAQPQVSASASSEKISLKNLMAMASTQKCEFSDLETGNSGTVYSGSGKFRGDFSSNVNGTVTPSHMVSDSKYIYIWMDNQETGFKTTLTAIEKTSGTTGSTQTVDVNKELDYKCGAWSIDPAMFVVPSDKKFTDMGKIMEDAAKMMPSVTPNSSGANCAVCDNLEGSAKTQCQTALKCN